MQYLQSALTVLFMAIGAFSTTLDDFPQCAQNCNALELSQRGRNSTDLNFICKTNDFLTAVESCEGQNCAPSDFSRIFTLAIQLCDPVGGTAHIGLFNLSSCAQPGLAAATAVSGCSPTNWTCICSSPAYLADASRYEEQYCSVAERQGILAFSGAACAAVGLGLVGEGSSASNATGNVTIPATPSNVTTFTGDAIHSGIGGLVMVSMISMMGMMFGFL